MGRYSVSKLHKRLSHRRYLSLEDIHLCKDPGALLRLFSKLGYQVADEAVPLPKAEIGFSPADAQAIHDLYLLADQIRAAKVGSAWRVRPQAIDEYLDRQMQANGRSKRA